MTNLDFVVAPSHFAVAVAGPIPVAEFPIFDPGYSYQIAPADPILAVDWIVPILVADSTAPILVELAVLNFPAPNFAVLDFLVVPSLAALDFLVVPSPVDLDFLVVPNLAGLDFLVALDLGFLPT